MNMSKSLTEKVFYFSKRILCADTVCIKVLRQALLYQGHSDIVQLEEEFFQINKGQGFVRTDFINVTRNLSNIRDGNS